MRNTNASATTVNTVRASFEAQDRSKGTQQSDALFKINVEKWVFPHSKYFVGHTDALKSQHRTEYFMNYLQGYCEGDLSKVLDATLRWDRKVHLVPGILTAKRAKAISSVKKSYIGKSTQALL